MFKLIVLTTLVTLASSYDESCHLREVDICLVNLAVFAKSNMEYTFDDEEFDNQCIFASETAECLQKYIERCTTDTQYDAIEVPMNLLFNFVDQLCTQDSSIRQNLKKNSQCLKKIMDTKNPCSKDAQNAIEFIFANDHNATMKMDLGCCTYLRANKCMQEVSIERCGEVDALALKKFGHQIHQRTGMTMLNQICLAKQLDKRNVCDLLPAAGKSYKSTNKKMKSIIGRLLKLRDQYQN